MGCKAIIKAMVAKALQRFTLTMWDVKVLENYQKQLEDLGFTLTMWDVKYIYRWIIIIITISFTLTMWDVKFKLLNAYVNLIKVLP